MTVTFDADDAAGLKEATVQLPLTALEPHEPEAPKQDQRPSYRYRPRKGAGKGKADAAVVAEKPPRGGREPTADAEYVAAKDAAADAPEAPTIPKGIEWLHYDEVHNNG